ncbi:helix-turn-helix domain-containing protein [Brenneria goodwinii]|uniref:FIG050068: DNA-binding protein n=1 Tax=Brenneria goodwinii TaxID=1109412 RepID=A0A0G4JVZ7_9GAMM|nr:helix-turn-helix domain-containing protein [Brenneria goodwinii]CPR17272.1 FIG050068: DNA-binding protein [Brenneria goodwinii]
MSTNLKELQALAQELHEHGAMPDETMSRINARVRSRELRERIARVHVMTGTQIKSMRERYDMSQSTLAYTLGMSVESVSKWERGEIQPSGPALRILNTIDAKGPEVFML